MKNIEHQSTPIQNKQTVDTNEKVMNMLQLILEQQSSFDAKFDVQNSNFNSKFDEQKNNVNDKFNEQNNEIKLIRDCLLYTSRCV